MSLYGCDDLFIIMHKMKYSIFLEDFQIKLDFDSLTMMFEITKTCFASA